jgi:hypothetical protein
VEGAKKMAFLDTENQVGGGGGGADVALLQCMEENECSFFAKNELDLDSKEMMIDTLAASVTQCMDILVGKRTIVPFLGSFLTCIINFDKDGATVKNGDNADHGSHENDRHHKKALDVCLMKNGCVAIMDDGLGVDVEKLSTCIGFSSKLRVSADKELLLPLRPFFVSTPPAIFLTWVLCSGAPVRQGIQEDRDGAAPCASLVQNGQHLELVSCFERCGGSSPLCLLECVQSHQQSGTGTCNTPLDLSTSIACLRAFWLDDDDDLSRQICLSEEPSSVLDRDGAAAPDNKFLALAKRLVRGLVVCDQCSGPRRRFVQALSNTQKCTSACVTEMAEREDMDDMFHRFWESKENTILLFCVLECYAKEV